MLIQYFGIFFAFFALSRVFLRWRDKSISTKEFTFWCIVWVAVISVAAFPRIFTWLSLVLGIGRGVDILLYVGMIVLFYLIFKLYVEMEGQKKEITKIVRYIAIHNSKEEYKKIIQKKNTKNQKER